MLATTEDDKEYTFLNGKKTYIFIMEYNSNPEYTNREQNSPTAKHNKLFEQQRRYTLLSVRNQTYDQFKINSSAA